MYIVWLVSYYDCHFLAWLRARFINTYNTFYILQGTLCLCEKRTKHLKIVFVTALRKSEKLTKQRISNKQNFTHLSATCDWNNSFFPLMNIFSCDMTLPDVRYGPLPA